MKKICSTFALLVCALLINGIHTATFAQSTNNSTSQFWMREMQDPNVNFRQLQHAFYEYWKDKDSTQKGTTFKIFKRWEYINENRVLPDGKLPGSDYVMKQYEKYMAEQDGSRSSGANWSFAGMSAYPINNTGQPTGMGRINAIAFHPTDPNTIFVGAPSGGLWKTTNPNGNSTTWINLCNNLPTLGVSSIVINPVDPDIIYIGTGDRDAGDAPGIGVYRTTDGGSTWVQVSIGMGNATVGAMLMHPSDPNTIIAATNLGIFKTTNGGASWTLKQSGNFKDLKFKPGDPTIVYAARYVSPAEFYHSANTGESWTKNTSLPSSSTGSRSVIGVSAANPAYVYVLLTKTDNTFLNLYRSTDYGVTFSAMASSPQNLLGYNCDGDDNATQATYDLCINIEPANVNAVYVGGINLWKSTDGGVTWAITARWAGTCPGAPTPVHADQHVLEWSSDGKLYAGHDGGLTCTANGGTTWAEITGALPITQIYKIGQGVSNVNVTIFGCQDNGCNGTTDGTTFYTTSGGDGGESVIDYSNPNYCYNTYVNGALRRSTTGPLGSYSTIANNGLNGIDETAAFIMPYLLHKTVHTTMFAGYKNVWRSTNITSSPPSFTKISTGETTNCIVLEQSPVNINILYVVRSGALKRSDNANDAAGSVTWTSCALPGGSTPSDLKAHPTDENIIYATAGQKVYKSINKGASWTDITGNLPALPINCLVLDKNGNEAIYIGNQTSVWYKDASMSNWILFSNGLPPVDVRELEIYYDAVASNNRIKAGTYGRGLWQSDLATVNVIDPTDFGAVPVSPSQIDLTWTKNASNDNVIIAWAPTIVFGQPEDGISYPAGDPLTGGGTIIYNGSLSEFSHSSLSTGTTYYYKIWSVNESNQYSAGLPTINATTYSHYWTAGAGTSDWFTPGNWGTNSVPTAANHVYIPAGPSFMPQINAEGAACLNMGIESGASLTMNASSAYTLSVAGDWINYGTFTQGIGTVDFNGSNALQQITGSSTTTFYTFSVSKGSASKMLEAVSQIATSNYLLINSGTFKLNNALSSVTIGGSSADRTIGSSKGIWINAGTMLCSGTLYSWGGDIRVSGGTFDLYNRNLDYGYNGNVIIEGGLVKVIRFEPNSAGLTVKYTQTGGELIVGASASTSTSYAPFDLTSGSSFTMTGGKITVQRASSFTSDFKNLASTYTVTGGTLQIGNASSPTSPTIRIYSTVPVYDLTINAFNTPYAQLETNGLTVKNDVTISGGGLLANDLDMFVGGNWNKNATFSAGTGTVTFNGTNTQNLSGSAITVFKNLTINNSNGILLNGSVNANVSGILTLTNGVITTGSNAVVISSTGSVSRTSGHIFGNLQKNVSTGSDISRTFEIGDATESDYTPVTVTFASVGTAGNLTASTTAGDHPNIGSSTLVSSKSVNRYWSLTNSGIEFTNYVAVFNFLTDDLDAGSSTSNLICGKYASSSWTYPTVGSQNATSTEITGVTSFSDFQLAEACIDPEIPETSATNTTICNGESTMLSISASDLNSAEEWHWYTGSCGGTHIGTGSPISVSPTITTTYYVRGEGGCVTPGSCSNIEITVNACAKSSVAAGGNWSHPDTWIPAGVPVSTDDVIINSPGTVTVDISNAECNDLAIQSGAVLIITSQYGLTVNGAITNSAGVLGLVLESGGSLITNSAVASTVNRYIAAWDDNQHGWHLLSSPVASQSIVPAFTTTPANNYDFYSWDELTNTWLNQKVGGNGITMFTPGKGYLIAYMDECTRQFAGTLNASGVTISELALSAGANMGWHLLGNPFPCALKWNDGNWALSNITSTAKAWQESAASYADISPNEIIPAMNGFMVETSGDGSLTIPMAARTHSTTPFYKSNEGSVKLIARDLQGHTAQTTIIRVNTDAGETFNPYFDSHFLPGFAPQFYSLKNSEYLSTQSIPGIDDRVIRMGFVKNKATSFSIGMTENNLPPGTPVYLLDKLTGNSQNLAENSVYNFTSANSDDAVRFELSFASKPDNPGEFNATVFYDGLQLHIATNKPQDKAVVNIYDLTGRNIFTMQMNQGASGIGFEFHNVPGVYMVSVKGDTGISTCKVVISK